MNLDDLAGSWDVVVVGGGITGAGVFHEAAKAGLRVLLLEQRDFAWGTSSRSSKLVHGGLRYLSQGRIMLTRASVQARDRLLAEAPGLVERLGFLMPIYDDFGPRKRELSAGLFVYDTLAKRRGHRFLNAPDFSLMAPHIRQDHLRGGFRFFDAQVDDARLVLRLIVEGMGNGAQALPGIRVSGATRSRRGSIDGLDVEDVDTGRQAHISASVVINATGAWAEQLHPSPKRGLHLRPLRGSHLIFSGHLFPLAQAVGFSHPVDRRPVFVIPWEGATLVGTTDMDHDQDLSREPRISSVEVDYLLEAIAFYFPTLGISQSDIMATQAGIRPVLSTGDKAPSAESREHAVWSDRGLITVTGGKLTTFRNLAWDALWSSRRHLCRPLSLDRQRRAFPRPLSESPPDARITALQWRRLQGRYGRWATRIGEFSQDADFSMIPGTQTLWAELPLAASQLPMRHLDDLLLRRVRIGLLSPGGAWQYLDRVQSLCAAALNWEAARWAKEKKRYREVWMSAHAPVAENP